MKKSFFLMVVIVFAVYLVGCSENMIGPQVTNQALLEPDYLYVSMGQPDFQAGAVFFVYANSQTQIHSDLYLTSITGYSFPNPDNHDIVEFNLDLGNMVTVTARRTPFKFSEIPLRNSAYPYDGIGIVYSHDIVYRFNEASGQIEVFHNSTGEKEVLPTQRENEFGQTIIKVGTNIKIKPGVCSTCNVKRWIDNMGDYSSYMPWHD